MGLDYDHALTGRLVGTVENQDWEESDVAELISSTLVTTHRSKLWKIRLINAGRMWSESHGTFE